MPAMNLNRTAFYGEIHRVGRRFLSRMPATNLNRAVFYGEVYGVDNKMCMILSVHFFFSLSSLHRLAGKLLCNDNRIWWNFSFFK